MLQNPFLSLDQQIVGDEVKFSATRFLKQRGHAFRQHDIVAVERREPAGIRFLQGPVSSRREDIPRLL